MEYYYEHANNVTRNMVTIVGAGGSPVYDAVLNVVFSDEGSEPVSLAEAKLWCAVDTSAFDTILTMLITKARKVIEQKHNCSLITRTIEATLYPGTKLPYTEGNEWDLTSIDNDGLNVPGEWGEVTGMDKHVVEYDVTDVSAKVAELKVNVLEKIAYYWKNRGDDR